MSGNNEKVTLQQTVDAIAKKEKDSTPTDKVINISVVCLGLVALIVAAVFLISANKEISVNGSVPEIWQLLWFFMFFVIVLSAAPAISLGAKQVSRQGYFSAICGLIAAAIAIILTIALIVTVSVRTELVPIPFVYFPF